ncbi:hypothetical protein [Caulobacter endophyticus]|nr:hypothetical protein [Caulobacter endophyticus]MDG2528941.1 hypothetical protein [Caulobacter endophyticus]
MAELAEAAIEAAPPPRPPVIDLALAALDWPAPGLADRIDVLERAALDAA